MPVLAGPTAQKSAMRRRGNTTCAQRSPRRSSEKNAYEGSAGPGLPK